MEQPTFSLARLLPDFSTLVNGQIDTAAGMSATIVAFLLAVAALFFLFALVKFFQAKGQVRFYSKLIHSVDQSELAAKRRDLSQKALAHPKYGRLWKEFDESLVDSMDGERLFNTLDAAHFFNTHSLARGLTENRLLAAVPGFLTAIGVLGTFAGLQMGLSQLTGIDFNNPEGLADFQGGISGVISGAAIAFMTSVWGVGSSLIFNFLEKLLERGVRSDISELQNTLDYLYPRINAEQSLVSISEYSKNSMETMQGLAEKIGDRMQEALKDATGEIRSGLEDSLNQIMAPAIKSLVDGAQNGTQNLLEEVMDKYLEGVGSAGQKQKEMMEAASKDVNEAVSKLGSEMSGFVERLNNHHEESDRQDKERSAAFREQLQTQRQLDAERHVVFKDEIEKSFAAAREASSQMQDDLAQQVEEQRNIDRVRQENLDKSVQSLKTHGDELTHQVERLVEKQEQSFRSISDKVIQLQENLSKLSEANERAATQMQGAANQLGLLSANTKEAALALGEEVSTAAETSKQVAQDNQLVAELNQELFDKFDQLRLQLSSVTEQMGQATSHAENSFEAMEKHMRSFVSALGEEVENLELKVASLMEQYGNKVNSQTADRMDVWNKQTAVYLSDMTRAVQAISNVLDEIEGKVGVGV